MESIESAAPNLWQWRAWGVRGELLERLHVNLYGSSYESSVNGNGYTPKTASSCVVVLNRNGQGYEHALAAVNVRES